MVSANPKPKQDKSQSETEKLASDINHALPWILGIKIATNRGTWILVALALFLVLAVIGYLIEIIITAAALISHVAALLITPKTLFFLAGILTIVWIGSLVFPLVRKYTRRTKS